MKFTRLAFLVVLLNPLAPAFAQSARPGLGAMPHENGTTFRVWAPHASAMAVAGEFNDWHAAPLAREEPAGIWFIDIPEARAGQRYKYLINGEVWKRDPRARQVAGRDGIIYDPDAFDWGDTPIPKPERNDLVLYQLHVGTFAGKNPPATLDDAIAKLDHVRDLGVNAITLMPVNEFPGKLSWGYNPSDLFAIEADYGGPDALKRFMRAAHERGLAVFMDVIHNHYGQVEPAPGQEELPLWRFDGWSSNEYGGIYFYNDIRARTPWGSTRPDYSRPEVRTFIRDQIYMFADEYRIGGFRWDSVFNIIICEQGPNPEGVRLLADINRELEETHPHVIRTAEDHAFDHNMHFDNLWDVSHRWALYRQLATSDDSERDMATVADTVAGGPGLNRILFTEAHDYIARSHDRSRLPSMIQPSDPDSLWARKRALLGAGMILTTPGIPQIFQGQEMNEIQAFHDDIPLRWERTNTHAGIVRAYTDLIHLRRDFHGTTPGLKGAGVRVHHVDNDRKIVAFLRWDQGEDIDSVFVVANFSDTEFTRNALVVPFPAAGTWFSHFNGDSKYYGEDFGDLGPAQVEAAGDSPSAALDMGRYSLQIFSRTPREAAPFGFAAHTEAKEEDP
jgi:1,4-alpha-glucan branching enzyme